MFTMLLLVISITFYIFNKKDIKINTKDTEYTLEKNNRPLSKPLFHATIN